MAGTMRSTGGDCAPARSCAPSVANANSAAPAIAAAAIHRGMRDGDVRRGVRGRCNKWRPQRVLRLVSDLLSPDFAPHLSRRIAIVLDDDTRARGASANLGSATSRNAGLTDTLHLLGRC